MLFILGSANKGKKMERGGKRPSPYSPAKAAKQLRIDNLLFIKEPVGDSSAPISSNIKEAPHQTVPFSVSDEAPEELEPFNSDLVHQNSEEKLFPNAECNSKSSKHCLLELIPSHSFPPCKNH